MTKQYLNQQQLSNKISQAIQTLAENVQTTLGPRGRNVILHKKGAVPIITKDGVTISEFIEFEDPFAGEDTLIPIMTDEEGYVEFSDLMFSVYGKAGKYTLEFVCEGVSLISKEITVKTSISKVKFTSQPASEIKEELKPLTKALTPII